MTDTVRTGRWERDATSAVPAPGALALLAIGLIVMMVPPRG